MMQSISQSGKVAHQRLPAYILTGFLGSGKTTLLGELIGWSLEQGLKPGLIINEFGDVSVDGEAVRQEGLSMRELTSGCVCCTANDEMTEALHQLASRDDLDLILVEASGLADPGDMLDELTDPSLWERLEVGGIISVLDSKRIIELADDVHLVQRQIQYSDVLVMNKCDQVDETWRSALHEWLPRLAPHSRIFQAEYGIPSEGIDVLLTHTLTVGRERFAQKQSSQSIHYEHEHKHGDEECHEHHHEGHGMAHTSIHTHGIPLDTPLDREQFEAFLNQLPPTVYRGKGFVTFAGSDETYIFQYLPGFVFIRPFPIRNRALLRAVFIGRNLNKTALKDALHKCTDTTVSTTNTVSTRDSESTCMQPETKQDISVVHKEKMVQ